MRHRCGKHLHDTSEAAAKCAARTFDRRVIDGELGPVEIEPVTNQPPRRVQLPPFEVAIYRENRQLPYGPAPEITSPGRAPPALAR